MQTAGNLTLFIVANAATTVRYRRRVSGITTCECSADI
jgi:hypothetical protein